MVRHDVEDDAEPGLTRGIRQRAELLLAAERIGEAPGVHHVVAVGRSRPRLEGGRQVEVGDPEVGEVGHELARRGEAEVPRQLKTVGSAKGRHGRRLSTVTERAVTFISPRAA